MASHTPIYEQFARPQQQQSIRSIKPVQASPPAQQHQHNKHSISLISSVPVNQHENTHAHPYTRSPQRSPTREYERPQSQSQYYYNDNQRTPIQSRNQQLTNLKHTRSQSNAQLPFKRKDIENVTPKRAQSVLQHIRVSHGSDTSEHSGVSTNDDRRSNYTSDTSASVYPTMQPNEQPQKKPAEGYGHHAAVQGAVGYAPQEEPTAPKAAFSKKIVVVGDGGSGKTSLLMRYKERIFPDKYVPTVFENYITLKHHRGTGKTVEVALWDTAGQEEYDRLRPLSYPETSVILVCFAIDCPQSLDSVKEKWYPEVAHFCPDTPILLVACKSDLRENENCIDLLEGQGLRPTTVDEGQGMANFIGAEAYIECSSKNMTNVDETFEAAIDVSVALEQGTDWVGGQVGQQLQKGRMGNASQAVSKRATRMNHGARGGSSSGIAVFGNDNAGRTAGGLKKKKKSRACKIL